MEAGDRGFDLRGKIKKIKRAKCRTGGQGKARTPRRRGGLFRPRALG
jgi:hypothetical protein